MIGSPIGELQGQDMVWLHALARRIAQGEADADDLVQETWMSAAQSPTSDPGSVRRWLAGILRNRERMQRRAAGRRRRREAEAAAQDAAAQEAELAIHRARVLATLRDALHELDEDDRSLLLARYCDEHSAPELADRLGLPTSTVRSRLSRAAARLRDTLDERWGGDRRAWAPAVLAPLPLRPTGIATALPVAAKWSVAVMSIKMVKVVVVAVVIAAAALLWKQTRTSEAPASPIAASDSADAELATRLRSDRAGRADVPAHARIRGLVLDEDRRAPIVGAIVMIAPTSGAVGVVRAGDVPAVLSAVTDRDGRFVLPDAPGGDYWLTASAPGHLPGQLALAAAAITDEQTLVLKRGGNLVEGVVEDIVGGTVEGTLVIARRSDKPVGAERTGWAAMTDGNGAYSLSLPDGDWRLEAGGDDYSRAQERVRVSQGPARVDFRLIPSASIRGRVVARATGAPVANAIVGFNSIAQNGATTSYESSDPEEMATTDADGNFVLRPLEPASYALYATASQLASDVETLVPLEIGEHVDGVQVVVDPAFDVHGFVVDEAERTRGLASVWIGAMGTRPSRRWLATSAADGSFELHGLPAGVYSLLLDAEGLVPSSLEQSIRVEPGVEKDHIITLARGTTVSGRISMRTAATVRVENRQSSGGFEIMLARAKLARAEARVADDGTFAISGVAPGEWKVVARGDDGSLGETEIDVGAAPVEGVEIDIQARASVRGVVHDENDAALAGVRVEIFDVHEGMPEQMRRKVLASATTDATGGFEIVGVEPGTHDLGITELGGAPLEIHSGPTTITLEDRAVDVELRTSLPDGRITGVVVDDDGAPVADAWVVAQSEGAEHRDGGRPVLTDAEGKFELERLVDRSYSVHARGPENAGRGSVDDVAIGAELRIELEMLGSIAGRVRVGAAPVERFTVDLGEISREQKFASADGSFAMDRVRPGKHHITVIAEEGAIGLDVQVEPGRAQQVEVTLAGWGTVTGTLVSAIDRTPLADVAIQADSNGGVREQPQSVFGKDTPSSDATGHFELSGIGGGEVTLMLSKGSRMMGEQLGRHTFTLTPGATVDIGEVLVLPPADVPPAERGWLGMSTNRGEKRDGPLRIAELASDGPAARAGLRLDDRVVAIDGIREEDVGTATLLDAMRPARLRVGTAHALVVVRGGETIEVSLTVVAQPK